MEQLAAPFIWVSGRRLCAVQNVAMYSIQSNLVASTAAIHNVGNDCLVVVVFDGQHRI